MGSWLRSWLLIRRFSPRFNALDNVAKPPNIAFETVFGRDRLTDVQAR